MASDECSYKLLQKKVFSEHLPCGVCLRCASQNQLTLVNLTPPLFQPMSIAHFKVLITKKKKIVLFSQQHKLHALGPRPSMGIDMHLGSAGTWTQHRASTCLLLIQYGRSHKHTPSPSSTCSKALIPLETGRNSNGTRFVSLFCFIATATKNITEKCRVFVNLCLGLEIMLQADGFCYTGLN